MNNSNRLLDIYMQRLSLDNNQQVADKLAVTRPAVSQWKSGRSHPNAEAIEKMCAATGEPLAKWLPLIEAERSRTAGDKRVWLRLAQAAAAGVVALISVSNSDVYASKASAFSASDKPPTLYIMS